MSDDEHGPREMYFGGESGMQWVRCACGLEFIAQTIDSLRDEFGRHIARVEDGADRGAGSDTGLPR